MSMFYNVVKFNILNIILISSSLFASNQKSLQSCIVENNYQETQKKLSAVHDINEQNNLGETVLHTAVQTAIRTGDSSIIALLLQHPKTNCDLANKLGNTPYRCAQLHEQQDIIKLFESHQRQQKIQSMEMINPIYSTSSADSKEEPLLHNQTSHTSWNCTSWSCINH